MHLDLADNHFDLFGIAPGFRIDLSLVESRYHELQLLLHPDRYATSGAREKRLAAQGAASVNHAYAVLTDDCARAIYLLELKGARFESESGTVQDQDFLIEQMELRERLEQDNDAGEDGALRGFEAEVSARMAELCESFNRAYVGDELDDARKMVYRMQFIKKFGDEVADKLRRVGVSSVKPDKR